MRGPARGVLVLSRYTGAITLTPAYPHLAWRMPRPPAPSPQRRCASACGRAPAPAPSGRHLARPSKDGETNTTSRNLSTFWNINEFGSIHRLIHIHTTQPSHIMPNIWRNNSKQLCEYNLNLIDSMTILFVWLFLQQNLTKYRHIVFLIPTRKHVREISVLKMQESPTFRFNFIWCSSNVLSIDAYFPVYWIHIN